MSSDAWNEIGDREKPLEALNPYRHFKPHPIYAHEPKEIVEKRRDQNLAILENLRVISERFEEVGACIHLKVKGHVFDIFPSTDCWISYSKNIYGTGISNLRRMIQENLQSA